MIRLLMVVLILVITSCSTQTDKEENDDSSLPKGWHYGLVKCLEYKEDIYCCIKQYTENSLKNIIKKEDFKNLSEYFLCYENISPSELLEKKAKELGFQYKTITYFHVPYRNDLILLRGLVFIWKRHDI